MPTFRLIHQKASRGQRSSSLTDFEYRVWTQYMLSADDFGVCPAEAVRFQADNEALGRVAAHKVASAIARLVMVGLVQRFDHQGKAYLFQRDWQDWQKVKYPSQTLYPCPPAETFAQFSPKTAELFSKYHEKVSEEFASRAYAGTANANANANANASPAQTPPTDPLPTAPPPAHRVVHREPSLVRRRRLDVAFEWRACVPQSLHEEFVWKRGGDFAEADRFVRHWYLQTAKAWDEPDERPLGEGSDFAFWRNRWTDDFAQRTQQSQAAPVQQSKTYRDAEEILRRPPGHVAATLEEARAALKAGAAQRAAKQEATA